MKLLFSLSGRAGRLYWWLGRCLGVLANAVLLVALFFFGFGFLIDDLSTVLQAMDPATFVLILGFIMLGNWITATLTVKRYHDLDKSGWWYFIGFVPVIGHVWQLIECRFLPGTMGINKYGGGDGWSGSVDEEIQALQSSHQAGL